MFSLTYFKHLRVFIAQVGHLNIQEPQGLETWNFDHKDISIIEGNWYLF